MRTEHYLFYALGVISESRVKFVDSKESSLSLPIACVLGRSKAVLLVLFVC